MPSYELLNVGANAKTVKGDKRGYLTGVLYLSPANEANPAVNLCPGASEECIRLCLHHEGRARIFKTIKAARKRKTLEYLANREAFMLRLKKDVGKLIIHAKTLGMIPAFRANGTSDVPKIAFEIAAEYPSLQCYDYTKLDKPWLRVRPNYHLTYSFNGHNMDKCLEALSHGVNVAVVFNSLVPAEWHGFKVIDGDQDDLRFLDEKGVIVGLKAKGQSSKAQVGGFIQDSNGLISIKPAFVQAPGLIQAKVA